MNKTNTRTTFAEHFRQQSFPSQVISMRALFFGLLYGCLVIEYCL